MNEVSKKKGVMKEFVVVYFFCGILQQYNIIATKRVSFFTLTCE